MAAVALVETPIGGPDNLTKQVFWETLTNVNTEGAPYKRTGHADRSVQVSGTFNGATCSIVGSNDGTTYFNLTDPQGNAITFTSADRMEQIMEVCLYIKPLLTGAGASTDLDVTIIAVGKVAL